MRILRPWSACLLVRTGVWLSVFAIGFLASAAPEFPAAWKNVQPVRINRTGLVKLSLPLETIAISRPRLEDLRLFDPQGREIPYLIERPVPPRQRTVAPQGFAARLREENTVLEFETGVTQLITGVRLQTPAPEFLKSVRLEGSFDRTNWRAILESQAVFRQRSGAERLGIDFGAAHWRFLRLTLDDRRSVPVPFTGAEIQVEAGPPAPMEPLSLVIEKRTEEPGETRLQLRAAGANVTLAGLTIVTPEALFMRSVTLSHSRYADGEVQLAVFARDTIFRIGTNTGAPSEKLTVASDVDLSSPEILLTILNDDNPPLQITGVSAARRAVYLVWQCSSVGQHYLLTGNTECDAPRYELASMRADLGGAPLVPVDVETLELNPAHQPSDPLAAIPTEGASLDVSEWAFRKRVRVEEGGLQELELDLEVLSEAAPSLGDLRLLRNGTQVPYVLERPAGSRVLSPKVTRADDPSRATLSRWMIELPEPSLPIVRLTGRTPAAYFERSVRLLEERVDERGSVYRVNLGSASWARKNERTSSPLSLSIHSRPTTARLFLEIENGDNPPIPIDQVEVTYAPARVLFKAAPGRDVFLYYGHSGVNAPRYDIAAAMPRILSAKRIKAGLGPEEVLKPGREHGVIRHESGWIFWGVLVVVVIGLLVIIARLLPKSAGQGSE
jgi:hypothetical protein